MSVQEAYRHFRERKIKVNRRYQRKLVWTLEEKVKLIDSILSGYPIPLILLAEKEGKNSETQIYEVMDGLQRLDAIFSFIENKFPVSGEYFDVEQLSRAKTAAENGVFERKTGQEQMLSRNKCNDLVDYQLAVTTFPSKSEEAINSIFDRINSYGRQLSRQDRRQAGVVSDFNSVVRKLGEKIRGDESERVLDLSEISKISIAIEEGQDYGIDATESFWCRQGVLRRKGLRDSKDEQLLADICASILRGEPLPFSNDTLDEIYDEGSERHQKIESRLDVYGKEDLIKDVYYVFNTLQSNILSYSNDHGAFGDLVNPDRGVNPVREDFYTVFMTYYEMIIENGETPINGTEIMSSLEGLHNSIEIGGAYKSMENRISNIKIVKGLISDYFDESASTAGKNRRINIAVEGIIGRSITESNLREFKQGFLDLRNNSSKIKTEKVRSIIKEVVSIANTIPNKEGSLLIGVTDDESDAKRVESIDGGTPSEYQGMFIVGVDREAKRMNIDLDTYQTKIIQTARSLELEEEAINLFIDNFDMVSYNDKHIILISIPKTGSPIQFNDQFIRRDGGSIKNIEGATAIQEFLTNFDK